MMKFYDDRETRSPEERATDLNRQLSEMVRHGYKTSSRVKAMFDSLGLAPDDVTTVDDLEKLPVISREDIVDMESKEPPYGGLASPDLETDRIFISPGPVYEPHLSAEDPLWKRGYYAAGFERGDVVINTFSYHMVAAGLTFHEGLRSVGATVVPSGTSGTDMQVRLINDLAVTGYTGTPSFLMAIIKKAEEMGYDFRNDFKVRKASFVAEPLEHSLRTQFEQKYSIDTYQMYGATEVGDIAYECRQKSGWHACEEVVVEIVDPSSGKKVEPGQLGEVVVTRLNTVFFLFRFATGDLSSINVEPCQCGRTAVRLNGIAGRVGDAVKVRGLFIAPSQLKKLQDSLPDLSFQLVIDREAYRDYLVALIETKEEVPPHIQVHFEKVFNDTCTVRLDEVRLVKPGEITETDKIIVDRRDWK